MKKIDFENSISLAIKNASKSLEKLLDIELRRQFGLSGGKWKVIIVLSIQNGLSQRDLAEKIFVDGTTLVPIIDSMEEKDLVERKTDPNDRRNNKIFLTPKSELLIDPIMENFLRIRKIVFKDISEKDLEFTRNILKKITENAESYVEKISSKIQRPLKHKINA